MKTTSKRNVPVFPCSELPNTFRDLDLPNMASHCPQEECGLSLYRGVLVQWDEDEDERIFAFIDEIPEQIRVRLLIAQEHEGVLGLLWKDQVPAKYRVNEGIDVEGDIWHIADSDAL